MLRILRHALLSFAVVAALASSKQKDGYPRIKAAIYWHERWQNPDQSYSNLHFNSSVESFKPYREEIANPYWLGNLIVES